jgi:hypothetical protein
LRRLLGLTDGERLLFIAIFLVPSHDVETGFVIYIFAMALGIAQTSSYAPWVAETPLERYFQANATGSVASCRWLVFDNLTHTLNTISCVVHAILLQTLAILLGVLKPKLDGLLTLLTISIGKPTLLSFLRLLFWTLLLRGLIHIVI